MTTPVLFTAVWPLTVVTPAPADHALMYTDPSLLPVSQGLCAGDGKPAGFVNAALEISKYYTNFTAPQLRGVDLDTTGTISVRINANLIGADGLGDGWLEYATHWCAC